ADFTLAQLHKPNANAKISCHLTALGGLQDAEVSQQQLGRWQNRTSGTFDLKLFKGGHFYWEARPEEITTLIEAQCQKAILQRPPSMAFGPVSAIEADDTLYARFQSVVDLKPDATALADENTSYTFEVLSDEVQRLSDVMAADGVSPGDRIALQLPTSCDFVIGMLAAMRLGAHVFHVPQAYPIDAMPEMLDDLDPKVIITNAGQKHVFATGDQKHHSDHRPVIVPEQARSTTTAASAKIHKPIYRGRRDDVAFGVLSSGTTGRPKAILCTNHAALLAYDWRTDQLPATTGEREAVNIFMIWEVLRPLLEGRRVDIISDETIRDPRRLCEEVRRLATTRILLTPSLFAQILNLPVDILTATLKSLRTVILNGEVVPRELMQQARHIIPHVTVINDYSISECHDVATTGADQHSSLLKHTGPTVPSGRPMDGIRIYILGEEDRELKPHGVPGDVYVAGSTLSPGYLNADDETAARFLPDPFQPPGHTMFRTGDVGRLLPDGQLQLFGRSSFMIKLRGYSIVPQAIEAVISQHEDVRACAIVAINDQKTHQPDHIVACIVPSANHDLTASFDTSRLKDWLRKKLSPEARPARIIRVDNIPISATTGKRDEQALRALIDQDVSVGPARSPQNQTGVTATSKPSIMDEALSDDWAAVLGQHPKRIDENFFDAGGHSLKAAELAQAVSRRLDRRIDVADIYASPTFAELSEALRATSKPSAPI
ncbi:MAG: AMP-binding protein, partial [Pseudomonadota bacterium]